MKRSLREERLRREYVNGHIEIEEFEERVAALLRGAPMAADRVPIYTDEPGQIFPYNPSRGTVSAVLKDAWTSSRLAPQFFDKEAT